MSEVIPHYITGDWRHLVEDGMVDHDPLPDEVLPTGHVLFEPIAPRVAVAGTPATAYTLGPDKALIAGGVLTDMQGREGIWLTGQIGGSTVRWRATVHLEFRDQKIAYPTVDFDLTEDVRLTGLIQQTGPHTPFVIDPRIEDLAGRLADVDQAVSDAGQSALDARAAADQAEGLSTAQDGHVAGVLEDPESLTHAAFKAVGNATYAPREGSAVYASKSEVASLIEVELDGSTVASVEPTPDALAKRTGTGSVRVPDPLANLDSVNRQWALAEIAGSIASKADLVDGRLDPSQLPELAVSEFLGEVDSQAQMLSLVGERGDWCIRTDLGTTVILVADAPSVVSSWKELVHPTDAVTSVAGRTGAVTLSKSDVGLSNVDNTSDAGKPVSAAQADALADKADLVSGRVPMAQAPAALAPRPMVLRTDQGEGDRFSITASGEGADALQWRFDGQVVEGSAPSHVWETDGPHTVMCHLPQGLTGNLQLNNNQLVGDVSQVALPQGLTGNLQLNNNQLVGDVSQVALPQGLTGNLYLNTNELTGDLSQVALPQGMTGTLYLSNNQLSGDLSQVALPQGMTGTLSLNNNQLSGDLDLSQCPDINTVRLDSNNLDADDVDATLRHIYNNRDIFTTAGHSLNIGGTNSAPSGTYQPPADPDNPTGMEMIYILAENPDGENFLPWQITYTGGTAG